MRIRTNEREFCEGKVKAICSKSAAIYEFREPEKCWWSICETQ